MMSENEIIFNCLGCKELLAAPLDYLGHKVRCTGCDLAMLIQDEGGKATVFNESSAETLQGEPVTDMDPLETQELKTLRRLKPKVADLAQPFHRNDSEESTSQDLGSAQDQGLSQLPTNINVLDTHEIKSLSLLRKEFIEQNPDAVASAEISEVDLDLLMGSERIHPPNERTQGDEDLQEKFHDEGLFEDTYLQPTRINPSKTIRGGKRRPQVKSKKNKINFLLGLLSLLLFGVLIFLMFKKPSQEEVLIFLGLGR
ncbi:hypothetical protein PQO03_09785 [Lentisphaera profundi]|uniref:Zinc finger/thioredoxin putative domain-containing protein n=1 Tax=Lentisphaera profundi TaxID=1658616 RepID=A0ABY7VPD0_9BACT|nr:hypothetical protein [Lentisphaera profundi]WDE96003.1 hypothetical protein PQO03_09785 [Lentisphaera profundi]